MIRVSGNPSNYQSWYCKIKNVNNTVIYCSYDMELMEYETLCSDINEIVSCPLKQSFRLYHDFNVECLVVMKVKVMCDLVKWNTFY